MSESDYMQAAPILHDLKSPLTALLHYVETLSNDQEVSMRHKDVLVRAEACLGHAFKMLNTTSTTKQTRFKHLLRELRMFLEAISPGIGINILNSPTYLPGETRLWLQILGNLATNAIEAGASELALYTQTTDTETILYFLDNGRGINVVDNRAVFELGFTTKGAGHGHGLAFVKHAVETRLNGNISVQSTCLDGTAIKITLPR